MQAFANETVNRALPRPGEHIRRHMFAKSVEIGVYVPANFLELIFVQRESGRRHQQRIRIDEAIE